MIAVAGDVRRHVRVVRYLGFAAVVFGLGKLVIDFHAGMPAGWTWGEGPPVVVMGAAILWLSRGVRAPDPGGDHGRRRARLPRLQRRVPRRSVGRGRRLHGYADPRDRGPSLSARARGPVPGVAHVRRHATAPMQAR